MSTRVIERTTLLPAPSAAVWHALMSPDVAPIIDPSVREWRPDRDPVDVGTHFRIRGRIWGVPFRGTSECRQWDPPKVAVFENVSPKTPAITATHVLEPKGDGTRYTWRMEFAGPWPLVALYSRLFRRPLAAQAAALQAYLAR